jgi:protein AaeX
MLRELPIFGALAPSYLFYFLASIPLFVILDRLAAKLGFYGFLWHPPLARLGLFLCLFFALVLATGP